VRRLLRPLGSLLLAALLLLGLGLAVALTADGLVVVTARHTIQHRLLALLPWAGLDAPLAAGARGELAGVVLGADGRPVAGATVLVAEPNGVAHRATTGADGRYTLTDLPAGVYRPVAAATGHGPVAALLALPTPWPAVGTLRWRPTVTVPPGGRATAELRLTPPRRQMATAGARLEFGPEDITERAAPFPSRARRQPFTLITDRRSTGGVVYAPEEGGPYPTVLIIYPGLPETWENVSVPLAAGGFTIVAFTPLNFPDLNADTSDLLFLTEALAAGRLSPHAAPGRQCAAGGSFSTLWTFLLLQQSDAYRCGLSLGGIGDAFLYFEDWSAGRITPDPRLAPVPEMMAAMGAPDIAPDLFLQLSAVEHLAPLPPLLLVHGSGDTIVLTNQTERLHERLRALGKPVEMRLYNGMEHYLAADKADPDTVDLLERTLAFFRRHLGP
jgi:hypothetical protein